MDSDINKWTMFEDTSIIESKMHHILIMKFTSFIDKPICLLVYVTSDNIASNYMNIIQQVKKQFYIKHNKILITRYLRWRYESLFNLFILSSRVYCSILRHFRHIQSLFYFHVGDLFSLEATITCPETKYYIFKEFIVIRYADLVFKKNWNVSLNKTDMFYICYNIECLAFLFFFACTNQRPVWLY